MASDSAFASPLGYDPELQVVELVNCSQDETRFVVESDRTCMFACPSQGAPSSGEEAQTAERSPVLGYHWRRFTVSW